MPRMGLRPGPRPTGAPHAEHYARRVPRSVDVDGDHVRDAGEQQHHEQRDVQYVPEREQPRAAVELGNTLRRA